MSHPHKALIRRLRTALPQGQDGLFVAQVMARTRSSRKPGPLSLRYAGGALAALCALAVWHTGSPDLNDSPWQARGSAATASSRLGVEIYGHSGKNLEASHLLHERDAFASGDGLSFALINRGERPTFAVIFARDAQGTLLWLHPAPEDADRAMPVPPGGVTPLAQGVSLDDLPPGPLHIVTVFLNEPLRVADLTSAAAQDHLSSLAAVLTVQSITVQVGDTP